MVCCCNCPEWYRVIEYSFENETRSDCINVFVYGINDSSLIQHNRRVYYTTFFAVGYAVPLTVICVLYVLLVRRIGGRSRVAGRSGEVLVTSPKAAASRRRVMRMVTAVIVTFSVCWLPVHAAFLVQAYVSVHRDYHIQLVVFQIAATCLAYFNSCLNPVIYSFLSENFRQSFRELMLVGGSSSVRHQASEVHRLRHDKRETSLGRAGQLDGHLLIPLTHVKLSGDLSAMRTVSSEAL